MKLLKEIQKKSKRKLKKLASTTMSQARDRVYYFGPFCLIQAEQLLLRSGEPIRLTPKVFDVLLVLIRNTGSLVTKDRLLQEVWPDSFVEEANLSVNIAVLRKILEENVGKRRYIETVPKRGYRFVAPVAELRDEVTDNTPPSEESKLFEGETCDERDEALNSLAVLPFNNESCDPHAEFLSTGLTESIINRLSQVRDLRVMARNTVYCYKGNNLSLRTVGQELGVRSVLAGRILKLDERLIVRTELVDVMNGWQLWGEEYKTKFSDILVTQEEIAKEISKMLRIKLAVGHKHSWSGLLCKQSHPCRHRI